MSTTIVAQVLGLQTANNIHSTGPAGTLAVAENVVINHTNLMEPARGWQRKAYTFGADDDRASVLAYYGTTLLVQYAEKLARDTGSAFTDYSGTFSPVDATLARMRFVEAASNLYFNCSDGTRALTAVDGTPVQAGVPKALRVSLFSIVHASTTGWQEADSAVAYRAVFGIKDENGNLKLGAPGGRFVIRNSIVAPVAGLVRTGGNLVTVTLPVGSQHHLTTGDSVVLSPGEANFAAGSKTVASVPGFNSFTYSEAGANVASTLAQEFSLSMSWYLRVDIPAGITPSHFLRLYRSETSATAGAEPSDELFMACEKTFDSADIASGSLTFFDSTPELFLGDPLYTNANTGDGSIGANEQPPIGVDLTAWDGRLWIANVTQKQRMNLQLLGVGSPDGIQDGDTLTIAGIVFTFKTSPSTFNEIAIISASTPSLSIELTARQIERTVNFSDDNLTVSLRYASASGDVPGKLELEERAIGGSRFGVVTDRPSAFNPPFPSTLVGASQTAYSDNNRKPHALMYSKPGQPEAVPLVNEVLVGAQNHAILRVAPLRGSLIVFKTDGIWTVTGTNGVYATERIAVAKLLSPETVVFFSDRIWALTNQGIINVTESAGVSVVSRPVESDITDLFGSLLSSVKLNSFAVGYESERRFLCWLPSDTELDYATGAFNYSTATQAWTSIVKAATCGVMDPELDLLVIGSATSNTVVTERKEITADDYMGEGFSCYIASSSGKSVAVIDASEVEIGDRLDDGSVSSLIVGVDIDTNTLTVLSEEDWTAGAATVYQGIPIVVEWNPVSSDNPALCKMHRQLTWLFKRMNAHLFVTTFGSELVPLQSEVEMTFEGYGDGGYGEPDWGNTSAKSRRITPLPRNHGMAAQLSVGFRLREAGARFQLQGWVVEHEPDSEKGSRR